MNWRVERVAYGRIQVFSSLSVIAGPKVNVFAPLPFSVKMTGK
jgi:hypothetical protein